MSHESCPNCGVPRDGEFLFQCGTLMFPSKEPVLSKLCVLRGLVMEHLSSKCESCDDCVSRANLRKEIHNV